MLATLSYHETTAHHGAPTSSSRSGRSVCVSILLIAILALFSSCASTAHSWQDESDDEFADFDGFDEFEDFGDAELVEVYDPMSGFNRVMFAFNDKVYIWVWNPIAKSWRFIVPQPARVALDRAYKNILTPPRLINALFQLKFEKAGTELGRLLVNSTLGIGGLFDPADAWFGWRAPSPEDFGQTLGSYGVGTGFPLVLPFLGPSNLRDGIGLIPDGLMSPVYYFTETPEGIAIWAGNALNYTSLHIGEYESLKGDALDPYTLFRDAYRQNRLKKIEE